MAFGLSIKIGADITDLKKGLSDAKSSVENLASSIGPPVAKLAQLSAAAVAAAVAIGTVMVKQSMQGIDSLAKLADRMGSTTEGLQGLQHAADLAGVSNEALAKSSDMLNRRLGEALRGYGEGKKALDALGLSAASVSKLDIDERFAVIADRMKALGYTTQQSADVLGQFGIRSKEIQNLMLEGGDAIRKGKEEIEAFGGAISRVDAKQVEEANDAMSRVARVMRGFFDRVAVKLAPIIQAVADKIVNLAKESGGFQSAIDTAFRFAVTGAGWVANAIHGIDIAFTAAVAMIQSFRFASIEAFRIVMDAFVGLNDSVLKGFNFTIRQLNKIPGVNISEIALLGESEFVQKVQGMSDAARQAMTGAWQDVADKWKEPLPSDGFRRFIEEVQAASRAAAEASVSGGAPDEAENIPVDKAFLDRIQSRLDALRQANQTEIEAEQEKYAKNLETLNLARAKELISEQDWHRQLEEELLQHQARMGDIEAQGILQRRRFEEMNLRQKAGAVSKHLADITASVASENKTLFEINKVAGIANAIVSAYEGISLTMSKYPYPINIGMAAAHAVAAFAQVNAIRSASFGGGGAAPSLAGGTPATPITPVTGGTPQQPDRVMRIEGLDRNSLFTGEQVFRILEEAAADGHLRFVLA